MIRCEYIVREQCQARADWQINYGPRLTFVCSAHRVALEAEFPHATAEPIRWIHQYGQDDPCDPPVPA